MPRFFVDETFSQTHILGGENACHIIKSLRMKVGENLVVCDPDGIDYDCVISEINADEVLVNVLKSFPCPNEPNIEVVLYQALPKSDKMDLIIQKSVELGVSKIVPILTDRCISRPDDKSIRKKLSRWQKISLEAAKQSRRGKVPIIGDILTLQAAAKETSNHDLSMVFYEMGGKRINTLLDPSNASIKTISIFIGPEGGFEPDEIQLLQNHDVESVTLGRRILRAETAPIAALAIIMNITENI